MSNLEMDIEQVKKDIIHARKWARKYFNVEQKEDHVLALPTFDIEYPEPDKIQVWPRSYGKRLEPSFTYTLTWIGKSLVWRTRNPFLDTRIDLVVGETMNDETTFKQPDGTVEDNYKVYE